MKELIQTLRSTYADRVEAVDEKGTAELSISLKNNVDESAFSQELRDHLVEIIDAQTILKINILNADQEIIDSFATNQ